MKISVSLPEDDVAYLDMVAAQRQHGNRSLVLQEAVAALRAEALIADYEAAIDEWASESTAWDPTSGDGLE